jgi:hypothetical protein
MEYRKVNADVHSHLKTDGELYKLGINNIVDTARKRLGPGGILGITNCYDDRYEKFVNHLGKGKNYSWEDYGNTIYFPQRDIWIVKGQEVNTLEGEFLVLGLKYGEHMKDDKSFEYVVYDAKEREDTISVVVHPFWKDGTGKTFDKLLKEKSRSELERLIDGYEVFDANGCFYVPVLIERNANGKAMIYYEKNIELRCLDIGAIISSDNHSLRGVGKGYTTLSMPELIDGSEFIPILRNSMKGTRFEGKMTENWAGALRHAVAGYGWYGPLRIKLWWEERKKKILD